MAENTTYVYSPLPPLPPYTLHVRPNSLPFIDNKYISVFAPVIGYWSLALFFHFIDTMEIWPQHRLHPPAEISRRNRATPYEVARDVILQQVVQSIMGVIANLEPVQLGKEDYDIAVWATRIRTAQQLLPRMLSVFGLDAVAISKLVSPKHPNMAGLLAGGNYSLTSGLDAMTGTSIPAFASWELSAAYAIYWYIVPLLQFALAVLVQETWQYACHRSMHMVPWLYNKIHSRHHKLYCPYAFGAVYNHPLEGFIQDTIGATISSKLAGLSVYQEALFFTLTNMKTVDDHCGYQLPWDPFQFLFPNNAAYHDIHHQNWGIKTNFCQPFFIFWDKFFGTMWKGGDAAKRREKATLQLLGDGSIKKKL